MKTQTIFIFCFLFFCFLFFCFVSHSQTAQKPSANYTQEKTDTKTTTKSLSVIKDSKDFNNLARVYNKGTIKPDLISNSYNSVFTFSLFTKKIVSLQKT